MLPSGATAGPSVSPALPGGGRGDLQQLQAGLGGHDSDRLWVLRFGWQRGCDKLLADGARARRKPDGHVTVSGGNVARRLAAPQYWGGVCQPPPRALRCGTPLGLLGFSISSSHHSHTLPCMSYSPSRFGWY